MPSQAQPLISLFRTIVLAAVTAFLIMSAALPVSAQNPSPNDSPGRSAGVRGATGPLANPAAAPSTLAGRPR